jgi:hypothetical protein
VFTCFRVYVVTELRAQQAEHIALLTARHAAALEQYFYLFKCRFYIVNALYSMCSAEKAANDRIEAAESAAAERASGRNTIARNSSITNL